MLPLSQLFAALRAWWPWLRWALLGLAVLLAALAFRPALDYLSARAAQHHGLKDVQGTLQQHEASQAADRRQQAAADTKISTLEGRHQEADSTAARLKKQYDAQLSRLPAAPELPRNPPRYRPGGR